MKLQFEYVIHVSGVKKRTPIKEYINVVDVLRQLNILNQSADRYGITYYIPQDMLDDLIAGSIYEKSIQKA